MVLCFHALKPKYFFFHQKTVYLNIRFLDNGTSNQVCFDSTAQVYCLYKVQVPPTPLQSWNGKSKFLNFWFGKSEYLHFHNIWLMLGNVIFKISEYSPPPLDIGPLNIVIIKFYFITFQNICIKLSCFKTLILIFSCLLK